MHDNVTFPALFFTGIFCANNAAKSVVNAENGTHRSNQS